MKMSKTVSCKYYKNRLLKITKILSYSHYRPYCVAGAIQFVKFIERRKKIGGEWQLLLSAMAKIN